MSSLSVKNLFKYYGNANAANKVDVVKDVSFEIDEGDFLVLVGPSGCGKSTLLNMIAGLEDITAGNIMINGQIVNEQHPSDRDIAMVFQSYALYPNMNVNQNLAFGLEMHKVPVDEREKRIAEVSKMLQIEDYLHRKPAALSGGQRQRVAMGRALVRRPQIFLFDEPLSNLDAKLRVDMRSEIKRLHQKLGATIVYVTHDQIEALTLSTKIAVLNGGIIQQFGTADDIYHRPNNVFVAQFMGSPPMNVVDGKIIKKESDFYFIPDGCDAQHGFIIDDVDHVEHYGDSNMKMGLRPEAIEIADETSPSVEATIDLVEPAGADCFVLLSIGKHIFQARMDGGFDKATGDKIKIKAKEKSLHFFYPSNDQNIKFM